MTLLECILAKDNLITALKRIEANQGATGIDRVSTDQLRDDIRAHWSTIRTQLLAGIYRLAPVRRVEIPKPSGDTRQLGIPTVVDRLIQQAILQELTPIFDPDFSPSSFGFRPGRPPRYRAASARLYLRKGIGTWLT